MKLVSGAGRSAVGCLDLAAAAVQGQHQLAPQSLAERVLSEDGSDLLDHLGVQSHGQVDLEAVFHRGQVELAEA
jgi:hypothetical protein